MSRGITRNLEAMPAVWRHRTMLAAPFVGLFLLALFAPSDDGPTICPFAICTGTACPGCGLTRAGSSLIRGDFSAAMTYHPLVLLIGLQLAGGWVWYVLRRRGVVQPINNRMLNGILIATLVALVAVWVIRLTAGTLPPV